MPDLNQLTMFKQKDVEKLFAATVFASPIEAIQQCGWLRPDMLLNQQVSRFWGQVKQRVTAEMAGTERVNDEVLKAAMECDLLPELASWAQDVTFLHLPLPYANEISRRAYMTGISAKLGDLVKAIQQGDDSETKKVIRTMGDLDTGGSIYAPVAMDIAQQFDRIVTDGVRSVATGIPGIDGATGGLERQTLSIVAARPSVGKTALGWQIAQQVAYSGKRVVFFSLEMSAANLWARAACPKVGTTWRDVRAGKLNKQQQERLLEESYALAAQFEDRLMVIDTPQTTDTIWQTVSQIRPDLIVVDHLRLLKDRNTSEVKRMGEMTQRLKDVSKNFVIAVLLLAQLNRQSEMRASENKRPILADLRDSGEIEENADLVLMLHRERFEGQTKPEKSITEVWIRKFRDGPADILIKLWFDPKQEWFDPVQS